MPTKTLEAALKTADPLTIFAALDALVRMSPSVSKLAKDAGADRSMLYRAFRREKGPRLSLVVKVLSSAGFQLIVNADGKRPQNDRPNRKGQATKTTAHLELSSNPKASAKFFTGAFETSDTVTIVRALDDTLRAQENVVQFSRRASLWRSSLYRSFSENRDHQFSTVVHFLRALGLRFGVVPLSPSVVNTAKSPGTMARPRPLRIERCWDGSTTRGKSPGVKDCGHVHASAAAVPWRATKRPVREHERMGRS